MTRTLEFASHPGNLSLVRNFVREFLTPLPFDEMQCDLMVLGIDEACTNVIRYAYNHAVDEPITLYCEQLANGACFRLRDFGAQGEPGKLTGRPLDIIQPGGLGLHLIRKAFDHVDYNLKKQGTELVLTKLWTAATTGTRRS